MSTERVPDVQRLKLHKRRHGGGFKLRGTSRKETELSKR